MIIHQAQLHFAPASLRLTTAVRTETLRVCALALPLRTWIVGRRAARTRRRDFRTMSGLELHDVGLKRVDVPNVGWDAWIDIRSRS